MCHFYIILLIRNLDEGDIQKNFCFSPKRSVPLDVSLDKNLKENILCEMGERYYYGFKQFSCHFYTIGTCPNVSFYIILLIGNLDEGDI